MRSLWPRAVSCILWNVSDEPDIVVRFPWPPAECGPNFGGGNTPQGAMLARIKKNQAKRAYKALTYPICVDARNRAKLRGHLASPVRAVIIFACPDRGRRDWDNFLGRLKPGLDMLVESHIIEDDSMALFRPELDYRIDPKNGHVEIRLWASGQGQLL